MDCFDTLHVARYWSEVLRSTIMTHPGWPCGQGHGLRNFVFKFLVKVFVSQYLLTIMMDCFDTLHVARYWSEVLRSTIMTHPGWPWGQGHRNFVFKFLVKVFVSQYLLTILMDCFDTLHVARYWSEVLRSTIMTHPGWPWGQGHGLRNFVFKFLVKVFVSLVYLLTILMDWVDTLYVARYWSKVLCSTIMTHSWWPWGQGHRLRNFVFKFLI